MGFEETMVEAAEGRAGLRYSWAEERMMLRSCLRDIRLTSFWWEIEGWIHVAGRYVAVKAGGG